MAHSDTAMTLEAIQSWIAAVESRPFAQPEWLWDARRGKDRGTSSSLVLSTTNPYARDSQTYDWDADTDEWTLLEGHDQTFTTTVSWPETVDDLARQVATLAAYALAHEALEWLRHDGTPIYDPHTDGDVTVTLPPLNQEIPHAR